MIASLMRQCTRLYKYFIFLPIILLLLLQKADAYREFDFVFYNKTSYTIQIAEGDYKCFQKHVPAHRYVFSGSNTPQLKRKTYDGAHYDCIGRANAVEWYISIYNHKHVLLCSVHLHWAASKSTRDEAYSFPLTRTIHNDLKKNASYPLCKYLQFNKKTKSQVPSSDYATRIKISILNQPLPKPIIDPTFF